jgi:hypothetical protein
LEKCNLCNEMLSVREFSSLIHSVYVLGKSVECQCTLALPELMFGALL